MLQDQNKLDEAEPLLRHVLAIDRSQFGDGHPNVVRSLNNLAALLRDKRETTEAESLYLEALRIAPSGTEHRNHVLNNLAVLLRDLGRPVDAEPLHREALDAWRRVLQRGNVLIGTSAGGLGCSLAALRRFAEAEPLLLEADGIFRTAEGVAPDRVGRNAQALIDLYGAWHLSEPDKGYDAKAAEWRAKLQEFQTTTQPESHSNRQREPQNANDWTLMQRNPTQWIQRRGRQANPDSATRNQIDGFRLNRRL